MLRRVLGGMFGGHGVFYGVGRFINGFGGFFSGWGVRLDVQPERRPW